MITQIVKTKMKVKTTGIAGGLHRPYNLSDVC